MATWKISVRCNSGALYVKSCVVYYDRGGEGKKKCPWVRFVERHKKSRRALPAPDTDSHVSLQISTSTEIYLTQGTNVLCGSSDTGLLLSLSLRWRCGAYTCTRRIFSKMQLLEANVF